MEIIVDGAILYNPGGFGAEFHLRGSGKREAVDGVPAEKEAELIRMVLTGEEGVELRVRGPPNKEMGSSIWL